MSVRLIFASTTTGVAAGVAYYTYRVEERRLERERTSVTSRRQMMGSVDDSLADELHPGDLVVFERDCTALHLPYAAHCMATKLLLRDSFDHVGVVFNDRSTRLPTVLEAVPWQGMRATPFQKRVDSGLDHRITVVPLELPPSAKSGDSADMRIKRVHQRVNNFANSAMSSTHVPTKVQDSVGLALNALLQAKILEPAPELLLCTPGELARGELSGLKEGAKLGDPLSVRALR